MKDKAKANLQASKTLLAAELVDPAMSRLYYALFQAGVYAMGLQARRPGEFRTGAKDWTHATICGNASLYRRRTNDVWLFRKARSLREQADYHEDRLRRALVENLMPLVEEFLKDVCS